MLLQPESCLHPEPCQRVLSVIASNDVKNTCQVLHGARNGAKRVPVQPAQKPSNACQPCVTTLLEAGS